ncbi:hypothetical protein UlMin_007148 [Ulmus minor]
MEVPIPKKVQKLWDLWNLRGSVLFSLFLQVFLICFASCRQLSKNKFLLIIICQGKTYDHPKGHPDIYAFWASFLLLHLGGLDNITSFTPEHNEFWLKHLFRLFLQVLGAFYSFFLTLPKNKLWPLTMLVFVVGIIKYTKRMLAFYLASLDRFGALVSHGYILHPLCFIFILGALIFFCLVEKHGFGKFEIDLTYALLVAAIILDSISLIKLAFSNRTLFVLDESWKNYIPKFILERHRWSRLVFQYDMVSYCLDKH